MTAHHIPVEITDTTIEATVRWDLAHCFTDGAMTKPERVAYLQDHGWYRWVEDSTRS